MNLRMDSLISRWRTVQHEPEWRLVKAALDNGSRQVPSELRMMLRFLQSLKPKVIMEIGTHIGGTFWAFSQIIDEDGLMISLDLPRPQIDMESRQKMITRPRSVHWITADSHSVQTPLTVASALEGNKIDFLFIDGGHLYESVKMDYEMYSPFVRSGGWIGFHDINVAEFRVRGFNSIVDVNRFWNELQGFKIELSLYENSCGIGLLRKD